MMHVAADLAWVLGLAATLTLPSPSDGEGQNGAGRRQPAEAQVTPAQ